MKKRQFQSDCRVAGARSADVGRELSIRPVRLREAMDEALRTRAVADHLFKGCFEPLERSPTQAEKALKEDTAGG